MNDTIKKITPHYTPTKRRSVAGVLIVSACLFVLFVIFASLVYLRGNVIWFAITNQHEVELAKQSYDSFHKAATEAYENRMRSGIVSPVATEEAKKALPSQ